MQEWQKSCWIDFLKMTTTSVELTAACGMPSNLMKEDAIGIEIILHAKFA